jgi:hypothetical protein
MQAESEHTEFASVSGSQHCRAGKRKKTFEKKINAATSVVLCHI